MNNARLKTIRIALIIAVLVACGLWYGLFIVIKNSVTDISIFEAKADEASQYQDRNRALHILLKDIQPDLDKLSSRLVASEGAVPFIDTIETLARETGLAITTQSISQAQAPEGADTFERLQLVLSTDGSWSSTYKFLTLLETLPYKITLKSTSFTREDAGTATVSTSTKAKNWKSSFIVDVLKHK